MSDTVVQGEKHLTASVWIVSKSKPKKTLLLFHNKLQKWVQPGGHVDFAENPVEAAVRETREETGIDISPLLKKIIPIDKENRFLPIPEFFLEENITPYKDQPSHFHLDMMYVAEIDEQEIQIQEKESGDGRWFTLEEALQVPIHKDTEIILSKILA
jgi:8-oxo-dGTP pyrophosphatase MutT (NUDIX family)